MIHLSAKIKLVSGNEIDGLSINYQNTPTSSNIESVVNTAVATSNAMFLGVSTLNNLHQMKSKVDYYVGNAYTNYGYLIEFDTPVESLSIIFDNTNGGHPTTIYVNYNQSNGKYTPIEVKSTYVRISDLGFNISNIYIHNYNWNIQNSPVIIEGFFSGIEREYGINELMNTNYSIYDRQRNEKISFGIISNNGSIEIEPKSSEIEALSSFNAIETNNTIEFYINNTLYKARQKIGDFTTTTYTYKNSNRLLNISFEDGLTSLQDITISTIYYDLLAPKSWTALEFLDKLWEDGYIIFERAPLDSDTQEKLSKTNIPYAYLKEGNVWDTLNKICYLCQLHIFVNKEGKLTIKYNGGK